VVEVEVGSGAVVTTAGKVGLKRNKVGGLTLAPPDGETREISSRADGVGIEEIGTALVEDEVKPRIWYGFELEELDALVAVKLLACILAARGRIRCREAEEAKRDSA
jgi:hypothetical protein